ncbi:MAG: hypothetical protein M5U28_10095 [Sandaracinaceae bacterium]|nr:hypothetical protein [Sandaracinaceae bacterium]
MTAIPSIGTQPAAAHRARMGLALDPSPVPSSSVTLSAARSQKPPWSFRRMASSSAARAARAPSSLSPLVTAAKLVERGASSGAVSGCRSVMRVSRSSLARSVTTM